MSSSVPPRILVTGATGQLVVEALLHSTSATEIANLTRANTSAASKADLLETCGIEIRNGDYDGLASLQNLSGLIGHLITVLATSVGKTLHAA